MNMEKVTWISSVEQDLFHLIASTTLNHTLHIRLEKTCREIKPIVQVTQEGLNCPSWQMTQVDIRRRDKWRRIAIGADS